MDVLVGIGERMVEITAQITLKVVSILINVILSLDYLLFQSLNWGWSSHLLFPSTLRRARINT